MTQWYYAEGGRQHGPIPEDVLCSMLDNGKITSETPVWRVGLAGWKKMGELPPEVSPLPPPLIDESLPPPPPPEPVAAGFWLRLMAIILDLLMLGLVGFVFFIAGVIYHGEAEEPSTMLCWIYFGMSVALIWIYFVGLECSKRQATWGKQAMEIRVIRLDGEKMSCGVAAARFMLGLILASATFGISFLWIIFSRKSQALHDRIFGTLVVRKD